ncbi:MYXO-CTERM sorting domain-containing protein [Nannocystis punicea]|uniref:MYXO-CTERM sorting domain-containing protein n=1 Tax=Nannocystis punicea TaxID=2995304 RepID=A0ABY7H5K6_9BACT|nr:MYXO-CTERM sorting domain-containing protein [Nannocystis poenicansa]WAS94254.1 MYXO-CTERM sorting domain-containing protein [Nannocystis poenicansa]
MDRSISWRLASCLGFAVGLVAREAAACGDFPGPCDFVDTWTTVEEVFTAAIPTDGMIFMRISGPSGAPPVLDFIEIEVTLDGLVLPGALEEVGIEEVVAWRPEAPFVAGSTVVVSGRIINVEAGPDPAVCGSPSEPFEFEVEIAGGPMPPLEFPAVTVSEALQPLYLDYLDQLVCCDGAYPQGEWVTCDGFRVVAPEVGHCAPLDWYGMMNIEAVGKPVVASGTASMISAELFVAGELRKQAFALDDGFALQTWGTEPFCSEIVLRNLVTSQTVTGPQQCHADALASQLGHQKLAPDSPALAACVGAPYVCEVDEAHMAWDPDRCIAWPNSQEDTGASTSGSGGESSAGTTSPGDGLVAHGCACASGGPSWGAAGLSLLGLMGLRRRRRGGFSSALAGVRRRCG